MTDIETIVKNSLLHISDFCDQNNLNFKMLNKDIYIFDSNESDNLYLVKVRFKTKTIEIEVDRKTKSINLEAPETNQEIFDLFKKKLLTSIQSISGKNTSQTSEIHINSKFRSKEVKDFKTKILYHFLKITNNKNNSNHLSVHQKNNTTKLIRKDSGCLKIKFNDKTIEHKSFIKTPDGITENELDEMKEDLNYKFIENGEYYSGWEKEEIDFKDSSVGEVYIDFIDNVRQFTKNTENKKLKQNLEGYVL